MPRIPVDDPAHQYYYDKGTRCRASEDGDCDWPECPQILDDEPHRSGRHCPLDNADR